jgi:hypothetical protein
MSTDAILHIDKNPLSKGTSNAGIRVYVLHPGHGTVPHHGHLDTNRYPAQGFRLLLARVRDRRRPGNPLRTSLEVLRELLGCPECSPGGVHRVRSGQPRVGMDVLRVRRRQVLGAPPWKGQEQLDIGFNTLSLRGKVLFFFGAILRRYLRFYLGRK